MPEKDLIAEAEEWLIRENCVNQDDRIARFLWLSEQKSILGEFVAFPGTVGNILFPEAEYCFVLGQFAATIFTSMAFIEHCLASQFFEMGKDKIALSKNLPTLFKEAYKYSMISKDELETLNRARINRRTIAHFRAESGGSIAFELEKRQIDQNRHSYEILEDDAREILQLMIIIVKRYSPP